MTQSRSLSSQLTVRDFTSLYISSLDVFSLSYLSVLILLWSSYTALLPIPASSLDVILPKCVFFPSFFAISYPRERSLFFFLLRLIQQNAEVFLKGPEDTPFRNVNRTFDRVGLRGRALADAEISAVPRRDLPHNDTLSPPQAWTYLSIQQINATVSLYI